MGAAIRTATVALAVLLLSMHVQAQKPQGGRTASTAASADCKVAGFTLYPGIPITKSLHDAIGLYSLPYTLDANSESKPPAPLSNWQAAARACQAQDACAMFTSDGYLIGAYRVSGLNNEAPKASKDADKANDPLAGLVQWQPVVYCSSRCCGTWVADGLAQQLLAPIPDARRDAKLGSKQDGMTVTTLYDRNYPKDFVTKTFLDESMLSTACAGKPYKSDGKTLQKVPAACPSRCLAACCKQLAAGDAQMGWHHFSQCSATACRPCEFQTTMVAMAHSVGNLLLRQYVAAKGRSTTAGANAAVPGQKGGSSG